MARPAATIRLSCKGRVLLSSRAVVRLTSSGVAAAARAYKTVALAEFGADGLYEFITALYYCGKFS